MIEVIATQRLIELDAGLYTAKTFHGPVLCPQGTYHFSDCTFQIKSALNMSLGYLGIVVVSSSRDMHKSTNNEEVIPPGIFEPALTISGGAVVSMKDCVIIHSGSRPLNMTIG